MIIKVESVPISFCWICAHYAIGTLDITSFSSSSYEPFSPTTSPLPIPVPTSASFIHIFIHMHVVHTQIKTKCDTLVICACVLCTIFTLRYERPQYILWRFFSLPSYMYTVWETRSALIRYFVALDLLLSFVLPVFFFFAVLFWLFV